MTEWELEGVLRRKKQNDRLLWHNEEPSVTTQLSFTPPYHSGESKVEKQAAILADARYELYLAYLVLNACTCQEQKEFIALRYFEGQDMNMVSRILGYSRQCLYDWRKDILGSVLRELVPLKVYTTLK